MDFKGITPKQAMLIGHFASSGTIRVALPSWGFKKFDDSYYLLTGRSINDRMIIINDTKWGVSAFITFPKPHFKFSCNEFPGVKIRKHGKGYIIRNTEFIYDLFELGIIGNSHINYKIISTLIGKNMIPYIKFGEQNPCEVVRNTVLAALDDITDIINEMFTID